MSKQVKIGHEIFRVKQTVPFLNDEVQKAFESTKNSPHEKTLIFEQYLDENDSAYIAELNPTKVVFKFDNSCRMFNMKGTLVGVVRLEDIKNEKWAFYTVDSLQGKTSTTFAFNMKASFPYAGEPEVIKWLIETNQYEAFKTK